MRHTSHRRRILLRQLRRLPGLGRPPQTTDPVGCHPGSVRPRPDTPTHTDRPNSRSVRPSPCFNVVRSGCPRDSRSYTGEPRSCGARPSLAGFCMVWSGKFRGGRACLGEPRPGEPGPVRFCISRTGVVGAVRLRGNQTSFDGVSPVRFGVRRTRLVMVWCDWSRRDWICLGESRPGGSLPVRSGLVGPSTVRPGVRVVRTGGGRIFLGELRPGRSARSRSRADRDMPRRQAPGRRAARRCAAGQQPARRCAAGSGATGWQANRHQPAGSRVAG